MNRENKSIIIGAVIIVVLVTFIYLALNFSNLTLTNRNNTITSNEKINLVPYTNYTCEELIPEEIEMEFDSRRLDSMGNSYLSLRNDISLLNNGFSLSGSCEYNTKVGQKASEFFCRGSFIVQNKPISDEGIIQEVIPRTIVYTMNFDDPYCKVVKGIGWSPDRGILRCKILNSTCEVN